MAENLRSLFKLTNSDELTPSTVLSDLKAAFLKRAAGSTESSSVLGYIQSEDTYAMKRMLENKSSNLLGGENITYEGKPFSSEGMKAVSKLAKTISIDPDDIKINFQLYNETLLKNQNVKLLFDDADRSWIKYSKFIDDDNDDVVTFGSAWGKITEDDRTQTIKLNYRSKLTEDGRFSLTLSPYTHVIE
ncbi:hypothetical protein IB691_13440 [Fangia hongkongensis]|nr:hypothetical protein [Fangia hongkongensis]